MSTHQQPAIPPLPTRPPTGPAVTKKKPNVLALVALGLTVVSVLLIYINPFPFSAVVSFVLTLTVVVLGIIAARKSHLRWVAIISMVAAVSVTLGTLLGIIALTLRVFE